MEAHLSNTQVYEALREQFGKERAETLVNNIDARVKSEVTMKTKGFATSEGITRVEIALAKVETTLVREFNSKLLWYSIGTVAATVLSLCLLAKFFI